MARPAESRPTVSDPEFRHAVELIDSGEAQRLREWIADRPHLLSAAADEDGSFAGAYFAHPRLLWFVAENPIRNGVLPGRICEVTRVLVDMACQHEVADRAKQLDYTLALVMSGLVARECKMQRPLAEVLISGGADPDAAVRAALVHAELEACEILLDLGANMSLSMAAGLGREDALNRLKAQASESELHEALTLAAVNGQSRMLRILVDNGADPNRFNPEGLHAHCTPLHLAVQSGSVGAVSALLTRGAEMEPKDKLFGGNARDWAQHMEHADILDLLDESRLFLPAIRAVREGNLAQLRAWLEEHGERVNDVLGDNPRTLLHYATDWPGCAPNVAEIIELLVSRGADVNARYIGPATTATETPLHWAASSGDARAVKALIDSGAALDPTGGVIGNGTPLTLAVIFKHWRVAELLVEAGASISLPLVAGMGRMDLVRSFFVDDGEFRNPYPSLPHHDSVSDAQREIDAALCLAARGGRASVARFLIGKGANVNTLNPVGTTALDEAVNEAHHDVAEILRSAGGRHAVAPS